MQPFQTLVQRYTGERNADGMTSPAAHFKPMFKRITFGTRMDAIDRCKTPPPHRCHVRSSTLLDSAEAEHDTGKVSQHLFRGLSRRWIR